MRFRENNMCTVTLFVRNKRGRRGEGESEDGGRKGVLAIVDHPF